MSKAIFVLALTLFASIAAQAAQTYANLPAVYVLTKIAQDKFGESTTADLMKAKMQCESEFSTGKQKMEAAGFKLVDEKPCTQNNLSVDATAYYTK